MTGWLMKHLAPYPDEPFEDAEYWSVEDEEGGHVAQERELVAQPAEIVYTKMHV